MKNYVRKTDEELKQVAKDLVAEKIFTNRHISSVQDVPRVFMVLNFLTKRIKDYLEKEPPGLVYEYLSEALPGISGMPTFMSARILSKGDTERMFMFYDKMKDVLDSV